MEHKSWVASAQFSPNGQRVVTASGYRRSQSSRGDTPSGTARTWDVASGKQVAALSMIGWFSAQFSPDGQRVVTVSEDHRARMWDAASGK